MFGGFPPIRPSNLSSTGVSAQAPHTVLSAPENLDFNDPQALSEVHQHLANTQALRLFCEWACDGFDLAERRREVATLVLCQWADAQQRSTDAIPGERDKVATKLAQRLSPQGQRGLQQSLGASAANNAFSEYLAEADRYCLAGHVDFEHTAANPVPETYVVAAVTYGRAADAYTLAGRDVLAARSCAYAALALERAAAAYARVGKFGQASLAYLSVADAYMIVAGAYDHIGWDAHTAEALEGAAEAYARTGWHAHAAQALEAAAEAHERAGDFYRAANVRHTAAGHYIWAGLYEHAAEACERAALAYLENFRDAMAAKNYAYAAAAYRAAEQHGKAEAALMKAGDHFAKAGWSESIAETENWRLWAAIWHGRAANAYENAGELDLAAAALAEAHACLDSQKTNPPQGTGRTGSFGAS